jgi:CDP-diacylglycerol--serine O-phosphatidyltransferase
MSVTKHIPNTITLMNLLSGCIAVYFAFRGNFEMTFYLVLLAGLFDFLDGLAARVLKAYSPMGKELDSLADMVSFGLVPGVLVFAMLKENALPDWVSFSGFMIPLFSALRLAKFNIDENQSKSFIGMPTPANAFFWIGVAYSYSQLIQDYPWLLITLTIVFSYLLVSPVPMFALKVSSLKWSENRLQYIFLVGCVLLILFMGWNALAPVIAWYVISSVVLMPLLKK